MPVQPDNDCISTNDAEYQNYAIANQKTIPECEAAPECELEITSYSRSTPTLGSSDGEITITVNGATGTTVNYYLDGNLVSSNDSNVTTHTYSNLEGGKNYVTRVEDGTCNAQQEVFLDQGDYRSQPFIVYEPSDLTATENPIILGIETATVGVPRPATATIYVDGTITDGDYIQFDLNYPQVYSIRFYARDYPDNDTVFLTTTLKNEDGNPVGSNTNEEIAVTIGEVFENDPIISRLYYVKVDNISIYLKAKEDTSNLNLILGENFMLESTGLNGMYETGEEKYDGQKLPDYSLYVDVFLNENSEYKITGATTDFVSIAELELPYSNDNKHKFDVSSILKTFVYTPKIDFQLTGATTIKSILTSYYIEYGEKYPLIPNTTTKKKKKKGETNVKWCINSAIGYEYMNNMTEYETQPKKFLTNSPNPKLVQRDSVDYLYILLEAQHGYPLKLYGDLHFYDGTEMLGVELAELSPDGYNVGGVYLIPCGYNNLNLEQYETTSSGTRRIRELDLQVFDLDPSSNLREISEVKKFRFNIDEIPSKFGVAFLNKLGTYDVFDFKGEVDYSADHTNTKYEKYRTIFYNGASEKGFIANGVFDTKATKTYKVNSGWIDWDHFQWLLELLASNRIYNYNRQDQPYLMTESVTYNATSNDDMFNLTITFKESLPENQIST